MWRLVTSTMIATFRRFRSVYNFRLLLVTFCVWFVVVEVATQCFKLARAGLSNGQTGQLPRAPRLLALLTIELN